MNTVSQYQNSAIVAQRNAVLKNTYWLLSLSLVPTVIGAWVGLSTGLLLGLNTVAHIGIFFAGFYGLMYLVQKNKNTGLGVGFLMLFTFFMGFMLSHILHWVLVKQNGTDILMLAVAGTAGIFFVMAGMASVIKRDISSWGQWICSGAIVCCGISIINAVFLSSSFLALAISSVCIFIFSAWMLFTIKNIVDGGETNYISATMTLYISIYNVFTSLLHILGVFGGND